MSINNDWCFDLEYIIFGKIKTSAYNLLKTEYPNIYFTTSDMPVNSTVKYPTVYIHELPFTEIGNDISGKSVNAVLYSMQIDVYTDTNQKDAKKVIKTIAELYKTMGFKITSSPEFKNTSTVYRSTMRVRREIGQGDIL